MKSSEYFQDILVQEYAASVFIWDFSYVSSLKEIRPFKSLTLGMSNSDACTGKPLVKDS